MTKGLQPIAYTASAVSPNPVAAPLRSLYRQAYERYVDTPAYIVRFTRREQVDGKLKPEEKILLKCRLEPASIYMRWIGAVAKNRELLYVKGKDDDMVHLLPVSNDPSGLTGGNKPILRPDSPHGLGKERYPVRQIGIGGLLERFGQLVDAVERGDGEARIGTVTYLGPVKRPEFEATVETVMHILPPGIDPTLPRGGQRLWYFDTTLHFPVLVIAQDAQGHEAEYYCFDRFLFPAHIQDDDFSPAILGKH